MFSSISGNSVKVRMSRLGGRSRSRCVAVDHAMTIAPRALASLAHIGAHRESYLPGPSAISQRSGGLEG